MDGLMIETFRMFLGNANIAALLVGWAFFLAIMLTVMRIKG